MTTPSGDAESAGAPRADEEYARAYALGYAEGVRNGLREILAHAARGHSVAELRLLIQSRLTQLPDEVERKRRTLLAAPRDTGWSAVGRSLPPRPWPGASASPRVSAMNSYLTREPRPRVAIELVREAADRFASVAVVSAAPPEFPGVSTDRLIVFRVGDGPADPAIERLAGEVRIALRDRAPTLVYLDAVEFLEMSVGAETVVRFVQWLVAEAREHGGAVVASAHAQARGPQEESLLEHSFQVVL